MTLNVPPPPGIAGATAEYRARILRPGAWPHRPARDAASLVILDDSAGAGGLRLLMGRRGGGHVFLPGVLVFPGGRVEPGDYRVKPRRDLAPATIRKLAVRSAARDPVVFARALAVAGLREAREETGFVTRSCALDRGGPDLRRLTFIARALTPAKRPRRYDTRFFCLRCAGEPVHLRGGDGELEEVGWYGLDALGGQQMHVVTRAVVETLIARLNAGNMDAPDAEVPFLFTRGSSFQRAIL